MLHSSMFVMICRERIAYTHDSRRREWRHHNWSKGHNEQ